MIDELKEYKGLKLYPRTIRKLMLIEEGLIEAGYKESLKKKGLFYKKIEEGILFADLRGTADVPIYDDTSALIYWQFKEGIPEWKQRRIINEEKDVFFDRAVSFRFSFYEDSEIDGLMASPEEKEDGYCKFCKRDFQDKGLYCSQECELAAKEIDSRQPVCKICGKKENYDDIITHHVSYNPEKTIEVCRACHLKIHKTDKFSNLKPKISRKEDLTTAKPKFKLVQCSRCSGKVRLPVSENIESPICSKCKTSISRRIKSEKKKFEYRVLSKMNKPNIPRYFEETSK